MRKVILTFLTFFLMSCGTFGMDSDSKVIFEDVQAKVEGAKKDPLALDKALRKAVKHYQKSLDKKFLIKLLSEYKSILALNQQHYVVEMFFALYNKDKKKFSEYLDDALSDKDKEDFLKRMKIVEREEYGGNG